MDKKALWGYVKASVITILVMLMIYIVFSIMFKKTVINGDSMYPTLLDNENVLVSKLAYKSEEIQRFDVVVFKQYNENLEKEVYYVKRVIALPGETIMMENNAIYLNGEKLEEYYGYFDMDLPDFSGIAKEYTTVGEGEYFVLGDNRNNSEDSRNFGCIDEECIVGKVAFRIFPLSRIGKVR